MTQYFSSKFVTSFVRTHFMLLTILCIAFTLRGFKYHRFPVGGETADEIAWTWLGSSLIQEGIPISWSYFEAYEEYKYMTIADEYPLVRPVLDHPPLFSFIPGSFHSLRGEWSVVPSLFVIRLPMVFLGTLNVLLLHLVAKNIFKDERNLVWLATVIYAMIPTFVFSSRLVIAENFITTILLVVLFILTSKKVNYRYVVCLSAVAVLTKVSGIVLPLAIVGYGLREKNAQLWKSGVYGLTLGLGLFCAYAALYNWDLFIAVQSLQSARDLGLATLQNRSFLHPTIVGRLFFDGWVILGFVTTGVALFKKESKLNVANFFLLAVLSFILLTTGEKTFHGWYNYPLFPIFVLNTAYVFHQIWKDKNYLLTVLVWILLLPNIRLAMDYTATYKDAPHLLIRAIIALGAVPLVLSMFQVPAKYTQKIVIALFCIHLLASAITVFAFDQPTYWASDEYFLPSLVVK